MADPGLVRMAPDFGTSDGGGTMTLEELCAQGIGLIEEAQRERVALLDGTGNWEADRDAYRALVVQTFDHRIGPIRNVLEAIQALPKAEPGPVTPPAPAPTFPANGFARTYSTHGQAWDFYPNGPNGPHHDWWAVAPAPGRVELYTFPTPLDVLQTMSVEDTAQVRALFDGWVCGIPPDPAMPVALGITPLVDPLQTMAVPVYWPDQPIVVQGQRLVWIGQGHSRGDTVRQGRVATGDRMWQFSDSGVHFEARGIPGRCAHGHMICGVSTTLSPNGDIPGGYAILALGMPLPQLTSGAYGPDDYLAGRVQAGQVPSYWQAHPLPPPVE